MTPILRCPRCQDELHKRTDGMLVCLEKTCPEFKKPKEFIPIPEGCPENCNSYGYTGQCKHTYPPKGRKPNQVKQ